MTDRLYYTEPDKTEFDATILSVDVQEGRPLVRLDRTAFYPTSGGQPFDTGTLNGARVVDVFDDEASGDVVHVVDWPDPSVIERRPDLSAFAEATADSPEREAQRRSGRALQTGQTVHGVIDRARRADHMQQHTGQHVLSAAFDRLFQATTLSFHLGGESSTIDLSRELTPVQLAAAEDEANRIVWDNREVSIRFVTAEEAAQLPLRKPPVKSGKLRLIEVADFDLSACGGTHVGRTGGIGIIAIASWERFKGGQRIEFVCGRRALTRFRALRDITTAAGRAISAAPAEVPEAIDRLQADIKDQRKTIAALQTELAGYRAAALAAAAEETPKGRLVARSVDADAQGLKTLASSITSAPGFIAIMVSSTSPALIVVARSQDVEVKANEILAGLMSKFGGRGGGKPDLAQGGGSNATPDEILAEARRLIQVATKS